MRRFYEHSELGFAMLWMGIYLISTSFSEEISLKIGVESIVSAPLMLGLSGFLICWTFRNGLNQKFGLCRPSLSARAVLWYIPLVLITLFNLWGGIQWQRSPASTLLWTAKMLGVGFLEEMIFRGFLFKALCRDSVKWAIVISSLTFGIGHVLNLFSGSDLAENLCQIGMAAAVGFLYVTLFYRSGSLIPCILSHGIYNSLNVLRKRELRVEFLLLQLVLIVTYTLYLYRGQKKKPEEIK